MELPILNLLPLPQTAIQMVTRFLRKPHPTALLIKELDFWHMETLMNFETSGIFMETMLVVRGYTLRTKRDCGANPYAYSRRIAGDDRMDGDARPPHQIGFKYRHSTGEPYESDTEFDDDELSHDGDETELDWD